MESTLQLLTRTEDRPLVGDGRTLDVRLRLLTGSRQGSLTFLRVHWVSPKKAPTRVWDALRRTVQQLTGQDIPPRTNTVHDLAYMINLRMDGVWLGWVSKAADGRLQCRVAERLELTEAQLLERALQWEQAEQGIASPAKPRLRIMHA